LLVPALSVIRRLRGVLDLEPVEKDSRFVGLLKVQPA
jgi:hypothetical protein